MKRIVAMMQKLSPMADSSAGQAVFDPRFQAFLRAGERENLLGAVYVRFIFIGLLLGLEAIPMLFSGVSLPKDLYPFLIKLGFLPVGLAQWHMLTTGQYRPWMKFVFLALDVIWLAFYQIVPNPWEFDPATTAFAAEALSEYQQQALKWLWLFFIWVAFHFSPAYAWVYAVCVIVSWIAQPLWLSTLPGLSLVWAPTGSQVASGAGLIDFSLAVDNILVTLFMALGFIFVVANNQRTVTRFFQAQERRNALSRYVSPNLLNRLESQGSPERVQVKAAVLFTDMKGFSALAENRSPDEVLDLLQDFHALIEAEIFSRDGTLEKYIGDAVMAVFGAPQSRPDDALRAFACATACLEAVDKWNLRRETLGQPPITIGVGLDYGEVVGGVIGKERNMTYAVVGKTVTLASRLEGLTRNLNCEIVMSERFREALITEESLSSHDIRQETVDIRNMSIRSVWALSRL